MVLAKHLKTNPRQLAQKIVDEFKHDALEKLDIAGPGFINAFLTTQALQQLGQELHEQKQIFFKLAKSVPKKNYNIEFVSANPTGPLHLGHGRGGIIGDVLGNVLKFLGHSVNQEFYINDAGNQINKLGMSFNIRIQQKLGKSVELPEDAYHGEYLTALAKQCIEQHGKDVVNNDDAFFQEYAKKALLADIQQTLSDYGIVFDTWFSEKTLHTNSAIEKALQALEKNNHLYQKDGATWFKSTDFGDDKDRVVKKATGELTYVAADIAYMQDKVNRGHNHLVMILGHDHHSYVTRLHGLQKAQNLDQYPFDILLYQLVKIKSSGQQVRMSKRTGNMITLHDIIQTVGKDVARFFYLNRKADAQLEFDLDLALKKTDENPVYYVQYAYVRTKSILNKAAQEAKLANITADDVAHIGRNEALVLKKIAALKDILATIGSNHQTHTLTYYLIELATTFHGYYAKNRVIELNNIPESRARLLLVNILKETFETIMDILGISKPEKM